MEYPLCEDGSFGLYIALSDMADDGFLFAVKHNGEELIHIERRSRAINVSFFIGGGHDFTLTAPEAKGSLMIEWCMASVRLFADDALCDEEWPLGSLPEGEWEAVTDEGVPFWEYSALMPREDNGYDINGSMMFRRPEGWNSGVGDCMPFDDNGTLRLFYLYDRRAHKSKYGLGAHRWAQICTNDGTTWHSCPIALDIDEQWEGSICTGSLIRMPDGISAYYAVRMSDRSPARIGRAVSADGVHFTKTGEYFTLSEPYEPVSARDPMVFKTDDGLYHMLVTTSLGDEGVLAHLTSADGTSWKAEDEPFIAPGWRTQPECADWFEWDGKYYLVFSLRFEAYYCVSDSPTGGWSAPRLLCGRGISVPKTARFGSGRIAAGFMRTASYAGNLVIYELIRRSDGMIACAFSDAALPEMTKVLEPDGISVISPAGRKSYTVASAGDTFRFGCRLQIISGEAAISLGDTDIVIGADGRMRICTANAAVILGDLNAGEGPYDADIFVSGGNTAVIVNGVPAVFHTDRTEDTDISVSAIWGECRADGMTLREPDEE